MSFNDQRDPVYQLLFDDIGKFQIRLSADEQIQLTRQLVALKQEVINDILDLETARQHLFKMLQKQVSRKRSLGRLIQLKGDEKERITKQVKEFLLDSPAAEKEKIRNLLIKERVYLDMVLPLVKDEIKDETRQRLEDIALLEETLVRSVLMAARSVARKHSTGVHGIEFKDAVQEAFKGVVHAVRTYNPDFRTVSGKMTKFSTYAYHIAEQFTRAFTMAHSRTVRIPRAGLDKMFLVIRAIEKLQGNPPLEKIQKLANELSAAQKNRELKAREVLSIQDIEDSLTHLDGFCVSLDWKGGQGEKSLEDILPADGEPTDEAVGKKLAREKLVKGILDICSEHEAVVILSRFPIEDETQGVTTYEEIQEMLKTEWDLDLNLDQVLQLEEQALQKLRGSKVFANWLLQGVFSHEE